MPELERDLEPALAHGEVSDRLRDRARRRRRIPPLAAAERGEGERDEQGGQERARGAAERFRAHSG